MPFPSDELPHISGRFHRFEATSPGTVGTCLGLAIVKRLTELHAGYVDLPAGPAGLQHPTRTISALGRTNAG